MYFDENKFIIDNGRKATTSGLIGLVIGLILSKVFMFSWPGVTLFCIFMTYISLTAFWGAYKLNLWFRKYKYRMPGVLWQTLRIIVILSGGLLGTLGWGFFEHFILLLSISTGYDNVSGMISAQIILLPYLGKYYARYINFYDGC